MWNPIESEFFCSQRPVGIVAAGDDSQAQSVRTFAEELNLAIRYYRVGTPGDFLKVISKPSEIPQCLIVAAHGDSNGLVFGEYMEGIDTSMLVEGSLPPECIERHANLPDRVIVNPACEGGTEAMARAFLSSGARCYIATPGSPRASSATIFMMLFMDQFLSRDRSEIDAWRAAADYDEDTRLYAYYDAQGRQRLE